MHIRQTGDRESPNESEINLADDDDERARPRAQKEHPLSALSARKCPRASRSDRAPTRN